VKAGQKIAWLDDTLARDTAAARTEETHAAERQLRLVSLGARPAEVRALGARIQSARTSEALLDKNTKRRRALLEGNAVTAASFDEV
jgi:multidrug resistance efflux pump